MEWALILLVGPIWWLWCNAESRHRLPRKLDQFFWES